MTLRVAVVQDAVGPWSKGGRESRAAALLPRLERLGFDVEVFTMRWWSDPPAGDVRYTAICGLVPMYRGERRSITHAARFALATLRLLGAEFDVIVADQMPIVHLVPLRAVAWIKRVPLVVQWHEVWGREDWRTYLGAAGPLAATLERASARLADQVVAVSEEVRRRLEALGVDPARLVVVPNAIDRARLDAVTPVDGAPELVSVGRLIAHKRVDEAIRALRRLHERGRSVSLAVIGDGPERAPLERLAAALELEEHVVFDGTLDADEDVWAAVSGARVLVAPSDREGFGLAVAESLALGTPVVCVDHPRNDATRLVEGGVTGAVVPPDDPASLTAAIEHWLDAGAARADVSSSFWRAHADLEWDASAERLAALLTAVGRHS
ncbi:MAG TPA: glycosyltransferase [Acidimicrobiales bacterium]|nr:glycosyltransferase [Acidimicrobiales bacterium]